jgi:hypothetical protein
LVIPFGKESGTTCFDDEDDLTAQALILKGNN